MSRYVCLVLLEWPGATEERLREFQFPAALERTIHEWAWFLSKEAPARHKRDGEGELRRRVSTAASSWHTSASADSSHHIRRTPSEDARFSRQLPLTAMSLGPAGPRSGKAAKRVPLPSVALQRPESYKASVSSLAEEEGDASAADGA